MLIRQHDYHIKIFYNPTNPLFRLIYLVRNIAFSAAFADPVMLFVINANDC